MGEPIAILALRRKRDQISGVIAEYERKIKEAQRDLAHVNASLRLFELSGDPSDFPPYIDLNRIFRRGETTRLCMEALRREGPLDTRQLTERVMAAKGLNKKDRMLAKSIALRIVQTLRVKGRIRPTGLPGIRIIISPPRAIDVSAQILSGSKADPTPIRPIFVLVISKGDFGDLEFTGFQRPAWAIQTAAALHLRGSRSCKTARG